MRAFREPIASIAAQEGKFEPGQAGGGLPARWVTYNVLKVELAWSACVHVDTPWTSGLMTWFPIAELLLRGA